MNDQVVTLNQPTTEDTDTASEEPPHTPGLMTKHAHTFVFGYLALIALAAVCIGVYAWQHSKVTMLNTRVTSLTSQVTQLNKRVASLQKAAKTIVPTTAAKVQSTNTGTPAISTKYLTITEWGVRAPYVSTDTLSYVIPSSNPTLAVVNSENLSDTYDCNANDGIGVSGAGGITRNLAMAAPDNIGASTTTYAALAKSNPANYTLIGTYVYGFAHDQASCQSTTESSIAQAAQTAAENFTGTLISKLEAVPTTK